MSFLQTCACKRLNVKKILTFNLNFSAHSPSAHSTQMNTNPWIQFFLSYSERYRNLQWGLKVFNKLEALYCQLLCKCLWCFHPLDYLFFSLAEGRWHIMKAQIACYCPATGSRRLDHFLFAERPQFSLHIKSERLGEDWERAVFVGLKGRGG